jgi:hypothetical protein
MDSQDAVAAQSARALRNSARKHKRAANFHRRAAKKDMQAYAKVCMELGIGFETSADD